VRRSDETKAGNPGLFRRGRQDDQPVAEVAREMPEESHNRKPRTVKRSGAVGATLARVDGADEVAGVRVTHPDRVMFADHDITKRRLIDYYLAVKDLMLPHVVGRPLSLLRFPSGADGDGFFQKHASPGFPGAFRPIAIKEKQGSARYLSIEDERGLVAAVQMGVLELHIWGSHAKTLEKPDRLVFDLDPDEAVSFATVCAAARDMRARLKQRGLESFPMATGGKGIHVVVPLAPRAGWDDVLDFAATMARALASEAPERYLVEISKNRRKGRIFIDYLRNARGATAIAPFSPRARAGAPLAWPVSWAALDCLPSAHEATVGKAAGLLARRSKDPWAGYFDVDQALPSRQSTAK
jgi:bifunctional non-homologous end joining protein LigD